MRTKFPIQLAKELIILAAYSEAIELLRPEAERGHPEAQFLYGFLHFLNPDLSSSDAIQLIQRAAQQGHANACYVLATIHDFDAEYQFEMPRTEEQWGHLRFASRHGSIAAKIMLAQAFEDGVFVPRNLRAAHHLLEQCVQRGSLVHAEACYRLGALLLNYGELQQIRNDSSAWFSLYRTVIRASDYDVIVKARHLMAERCRLEIYKPERKDILGVIHEMNRDFRRLTPTLPRPAWVRFLDDYCRRMLVYDLSEVTFEGLVSFLFDHAVPEEDVQRWQMRWDFIAEIRFSPHILTQHYTRLFQDPAFLLEYYTPQELNQGFWYMIMGGSYKNGYLNVGAVIRHQTVSVQEAEMCLEAMYDLFVKLFSRPDLPELTHDAAYMWWDSNFCNFWAYTGPKTDYDRRRDALNPIRRTDAATAQRFNDINLDVMRRVLELDSIDCKRAALHGLGHLNHPGKEQVIRDFLAANPDLPDFENWYEYGMAAIEGKVM